MLQDALPQRHVAFELHPGIVYSDGYGEMTADDVKFSFERIADPKTKADYHDDWAQLDHVEVKDKYSGIIVMKKVFAPLWTSTLPTDSAVVLPKKAYDAVGGKFTTKPPCQVGPYRINSVQYRAIAVTSNKTVQEAVRAFGQSPTNFALERTIEEVARHLNLDRLEVRRRNRREMRQMSPAFFNYGVTENRPLSESFDLGGRELLQFVTPQVG